MSSSTHHPLHHVSVHAHHSGSHHPRPHHALRQYCCVIRAGKADGEE